MDKPARPDDCTCEFPESFAETASGHAVTCPAHDRVIAEIEAIATGREAPPRPRFRFFVWGTGGFSMGPSFCPGRDPIGPRVCSAPAGWMFQPDDRCGVAIVGPGGAILDAARAYDAAEKGNLGFRID